MVDVVGVVGRSTFLPSTHKLLVHFFSIYLPILKPLALSCLSVSAAKIVTSSSAYVCSFYDIGNSCFFQMKTYTHKHHDFSSRPKLEDILMCGREATVFHPLTLLVHGLCIPLRSFEALWKPSNLYNFLLCSILATTLIHFLLSVSWLWQLLKQHDLPLFHILIACKITDYYIQIIFWNYFFSPPWAP